jgi:putative endonuclease
MSQGASTGKIGEEIATRFLIKKGYEILELNYRKFHGEIDIIAKDLDEVVFVEVKTVTRESFEGVPRETYRPEDNMHKSKLKTVSRTAELYMIDKGLDSEWRIDSIAVEMEKSSKKAKVRHLKAVYL